MIEATCHAALATGDRVVTVSPSFGLHEIFPLAMGATVEKVPMTPALQFDLPRLIDAVSSSTQMLIFSNPSNPVGCILESGDFLRLVSSCLHRVTSETRRRRASLFEELTTLARHALPRMKVFASHANFLFIDTGCPATLVAERLMAKGDVMDAFPSSSAARD